MKDVEIIKAFEAFSDKVSCMGCPFENELSLCFECTAIPKTFCEAVIDLINRKNAEIERLQAMVNAELDTIHDLGDDYERALEEEQELVKKARTEAIKEFAVRLKKKTYPFPCAIGVENAVTIRGINDLVKEMVGDAE